MSENAQDLLQQIRLSPASVQREVARAILEHQFRPCFRGHIRPGRIADISGRYPPQPLEEAKPHDQWFVEAIVASKSAAE